MTTIVIPLSYERPPLTTNRIPRNHYQRSRIVRQIQSEVGIRVRARWGNYRPMLTGPVEVCLVWTVPDRRVRDSSGPDPTLKAAQDGLVKAGFLAEDRHEIVTKSYCRIELGARYGMRIEITDSTPEARPA